jgi:hypothetical protein
LVKMTNEQLIERIRTGLNDEVARLHPAADLLEQLRSVPAVRPRSVVRLRAGAGGAVALFASIAVVAAIVAVAFVSLGHGRSSPTGVESVPAQTPAGARALVAQLAVLRRPQTPADRLPASLTPLISGGGFSFRIIPGLTRLAATIDAGPGPLSSVDIYVVVGARAGVHADIVTTLAVAGPSAHRYLLSLPDFVDEQTASATGDLTPTAVSTAGQIKEESRNTHPVDTLTGQSGVRVGVVPDGVSRVRWVFGPAPQGLLQRNHSQRRSASHVTVRPQIENNVAVAKVSGFEQLSTATWYDRYGRVIAP